MVDILIVYVHWLFNCSSCVVSVTWIFFLPWHSTPYKYGEDDLRFAVKSEWADLLSNSCLFFIFVNKNFKCLNLFIHKVSLLFSVGASIKKIHFLFHYSLQFLQTIMNIFVVWIYSIGKEFIIFLCGGKNVWIFN